MKKIFIVFFIFVSIFIYAQQLTVSEILGHYINYEYQVGLEISIDSIKVYKYVDDSEELDVLIDTVYFVDDEGYLCYIPLTDLKKRRFWFNKTNNGDIFSTFNFDGTTIIFKKVDTVNGGLKDDRED